jgi:hypothetical protein
LTPKVLIIIPRAPNTAAAITEKSQLCVDAAIMHCRTELDVQLYIDDAPYPSHASDRRWGSKIARVRNAIVEHLLPRFYDYFLWIDADVVECPPDMPIRLLECNPDGVSAPLSLIEGTDYLYDWTAFILEGKDTVAPDLHAPIVERNLFNRPPYWAPEPVEDVVPMDCVGMVTMVPTWVYKSGVRYEDHPAFTEHFSICKAVRNANKRVVCHRKVIAYHADLPKYGVPYH